MDYNQEKTIKLRKEKRFQRGFSMIELIMVLLIIAVLAVAGSFVMTYFLQNSVYIPNKLNLDMLITDAFDIMIDGDQQAGGLRFSRQITRARRHRVIFEDQNGQTVRLIRRSDQKLYRRIGSSPAELTPYYQPAPVNFTARNNRTFVYYDANDNVTSVPADVRRIEINLIAQTGSGVFQEWQARSELSTSIAVNTF